MDWGLFKHNLGHFKLGFGHFKLQMEHFKLGLEHLKHNRGHFKLFQKVNSTQTTTCLLFPSAGLKIPTVPVWKRELSRQTKEVVKYWVRKRKMENGPWDTEGSGHCGAVMVIMSLQCLIEDQDNVCWVKDSSGLLYFDSNIFIAWRHYQYDISTPSCRAEEWSLARLFILIKWRHLSS